MNIYGINRMVETSPDPHSQIAITKTIDLFQLKGTEWALVDFLEGDLKLKRAVEQFTKDNKLNGVFYYLGVNRTPFDGRKTPYKKGDFDNPIV